MNNILDYLAWRGDLPLGNQFPLNDLDCLALARFSYLPLNKLPLNDHETVASINGKTHNLPDEDFRRQDRKLLELMAEGDRFSQVEVTDYVKTNVPEEEKQFGAVTLHLSPRDMAISFCGTDSTVYGWKEDFNMSFEEEVPAQASAKEYALRVMEKYPEKKVRLIGHSKGGNLAVFVFYTLPEELQKRVIYVKNFDGPGFHNDFLDRCATPSLLNRIFTFLPQDSVFGRILERREAFRVISSEETGVEQHDVYHWNLTPAGFVAADALSDYSNIIDTVISKVLYQNTREDRKRYIDGIYEFVQATSAETTAEFRKGFPNNIPTILHTINTMPEEERKLINQITLEFGSAFAETTAKTQGEKLSQFLQDSASKLLP